MGYFEAISFVDNDREGAIGKLEEVEKFYRFYSVSEFGTPASSSKNYIC